MRECPDKSAYFYDTVEQKMTIEFPSVFLSGEIEGIYITTDCAWSVRSCFENKLLSSWLRFINRVFSNRNRSVQTVDFLKLSGSIGFFVFKTDQTCPGFRIEIFPTAQFFSAFDLNLWPEAHRPLLINLLVVYNEMFRNSTFNKNQRFDSLLPNAWLWYIRWMTMEQRRNPSIYCKNYTKLLLGLKSISQRISRELLVQVPYINYYYLATKAILEQMLDHLVIGRPVPCLSWRA